MVLEIFTAVVAVLAVGYAGVAKFIQSKLINRDEVEAMQKESKALSEDLKKAKDSGNQARIDAAMQKQMEFLPKMNKIMFAQFKPMIVIMAVFFAMTWVVGHIDPNISDDITVILMDDGEGCDAFADDGIFTACQELEGHEGKWTATGRAMSGGSELGKNSTYFYYNEVVADSYAEGPTGEPVIIYTEKERYYSGESVKLMAESSRADQVVATLDSGSSFSVTLPVTIPLLNVKTIYQPYWWFILISLITNLGLSVVIGQVRKLRK